MRIAGTLLVCLSLLLLSAGCDKPREPASSAATTPVVGPKGEAVTAPRKLDKPPAEWTANEILQQLLATYRAAKTYRDQAVVRLSFRQGGQLVTQEQPTAVAFERPGKLSLVAYQATVKCDGRELRARIDDPITNNVDGQILVRPAHQELKLGDLASDKLLYDILISRLQRQPIQLELLLESGGLVSAFGTDVACERLADDRHDGHACFRVTVPSPGGAFT